MLKQCLTLLKHAKTVFKTVKACLTVVNTVLSRSEALWANLSLFPTLFELWARGQKPFERIFFSFKRSPSCEQEAKSLVSQYFSLLSAFWLSYQQEPCEPSVSRMWALSWEISSQDPCSAYSAASALEHLMLLCLNHFHFHFHANHVNIWSFVKLPGPKLLDIFNVHQDGKLILIPTAMLMCEWSDEQTNRSAECDISVSRLLPNFSGG